MIYLKKVINVLSIALCIFGLILMIGTAGRMETDVSFPIGNGITLIILGLLCMGQRVIFNERKSY